MYFVGGVHLSQCVCVYLRSETAIFYYKIVFQNLVEQKEKAATKYQSLLEQSRQVSIHFVISTAVLALSILHHNLVQPSLCIISILLSTIAHHYITL